MSRDFGISPVKYLSSGKERLGSMQVASTSKTSNRNLFHFLDSFLFLVALQQTVNRTERAVCGTSASMFRRVARRHGKLKLV